MKAMRSTSDILKCDHITARADGLSPEIVHNLDYPLVLSTSCNPRPSLGVHVEDQDQRS